MKRFLKIFICIFAILLCLPGCSKTKKEYEFTTQTPKTMVPVVSPGYSDLYTADLDSLKKMSGMIYKGESFGEITSEKDAVNAAVTAISDIYGDAFDGYEPLVVGFNERANCWIVHGTPKDNRNTGVSFVAIRKVDGTVVMIRKNPV